VTVDVLLIEKEELVHEYGAFFEGKTKDELEDLAKSFSLGKSPLRCIILTFQPIVPSAPNSMQC
jgi:hypothetical protein